MAPYRFPMGSWSRIGGSTLYANHSKLNSQDDWGNVYDHSMSTFIFILIINKIWGKTYEGKGYGRDMDELIISH